jgi:hypothetical protein
MRDHVEGALRRTHTSELANTTIDVYEPTETETVGEGINVSYPDTPTNEALSARADEPQPESDRDAGGTTADVDRVYRVRDDARDTWTGFGVAGEAALRIEDGDTGETYLVANVVDERNGLIRLECRER